MKAVIIGDIHFDVNQGRKEILEIQLAFFENQVFPYMEEHGITKIFQLGDFWDNRVHTNNYVANEVQRRIFDAHPEYEWEILLGNHDIFLKTSLDYSMMYILEKANSNITLHSETNLLAFDGKMIQMTPWLLENRLSVDREAEVVLGHFEMQDFYVSRTYKSTHGLNPDKLPKDLPILSGHYHNKQKKGNIFYIGTPIQLTWSDYEEEKGFYVYEGDWEDLTFIENNEFKHLKVYFDIDTKEMEVNGFLTPKNLKYRKNMDLSLFKNNKVKVYAPKELAVVKTFLEILKDVVYSVDLEIIKETEELDTEEILEKVKDYDITDSLIAINDDEDKNVLAEIISEAKNNMKDA